MVPSCAPVHQEDPEVWQVHGWGWSGNAAHRRRRPDRALRKGEVASPFLGPPRTLRSDTLLHVCLKVWLSPHEHEFHEEIHLEMSVSWCLW